jgi:hypothetical protein
MVTSDFLELVYELLDAHADTAELATQLVLDDDWLAHLEYLRALQRQGRRLLAQTTATPPRPLTAGLRANNGRPPR